MSGTSDLVGRVITVNTNSVVVDCELLDGEPRAAKEEVLDAAEQIARARGKYTIVLKRHDPVEGQARARGYVGTPGGYLVKRNTGTSPAVETCVVRKIVHDTAVDKALIEDIRNLCPWFDPLGEADSDSDSDSDADSHSDTDSNTLVHGDNAMYVGISSSDGMPCAAALVSHSADEWTIEKLCSAVRGAGKAVFDHVVGEAIADGARSLSIEPVNDSLRDLYSSWGVVDDGDDDVLTFDLRRQGKRRRVATDVSAGGRPKLSPWILHVKKTYSDMQQRHGGRGRPPTYKDAMTIAARTWNSSNNARSTR